MHTTGMPLKKVVAELSETLYVSEKEVSLYCFVFPTWVRFLYFISMVMPSWQGCMFSGNEAESSVCRPASWLKCVKYAFRGLILSTRSIASLILRCAKCCMSQSIYYQGIDALQLIKFLFRDCLRICYVCEVSDAVSEYWQFPVHNLYRHDLQPVYEERRIVNDTHVESGYSRI